MNEAELLKLFSEMSSGGLEAFRMWLIFKYVEMVAIPLGVAFIFGFVVYLVFRFIKTAKDW